jgi:cold shock CspA family protein
MKAVFARKGTAMKHFGTIQSFSERTGHGFIRRENGGRDLSFEKCEILWESMISPISGMLVSYRLSGRNGEVSAIDLRLASAVPTHSRRKSFSVFRSVAEEAATKAEQDEWDNEGGHMSSTSGLVVSTPGAELPYKVVLRHEGSPDTERAFGTMQECEAFIRRKTPKPKPRSTLLDQEASAL